MALTAERLAQAFTLQAQGCEYFGSKLYAGMSLLAAANIAGQGELWKLIADFQDDPTAANLPLRVLGGLHYLAIAGRAPDLAAFFPSCGGDAALGANAGPAWEAALATMRREAPTMRRFLLGPPQTNEVGRSAALLPGFLRIAKLTGLPLRPREIGASAGLIQNWDRFVYSYNDGQINWSGGDARLVLGARWHGPPGDFEQRVVVASRAGCDIAPMDATDRETQMRLKCFVWPDQPHRYRSLEGALQIAADRQVKIEKINASAFARRELADRPQGQATVIYHTIVRQYFPPDEGAAFDNAVIEAGQKADAARPVAWLRLEQTTFKGPFELRLSLWPHGIDCVLATAHPHGASVKWLG